MNKYSRSVIVCVASLAALVSSTSVSAQTGWKATQVWQVDGSEGGDPFQSLRDFVVLKDGQMWALDFKDQFIRRYDVNGKFLGVVGRKGRGPGEMDIANGMAVAKDGTVWVNDPSNARINVYSASGSFLRQISRDARGYGYRWDGWFNRLSGELYDGNVGAPRVWQHYDATGVRRDTLSLSSCKDPGYVTPNYRGQTKSPPSMMGGNYPFTGGGGQAPDGRGAIWCAWTKSKRVALLRLGTNDTVLTTNIDIPMVDVPSAERAAQIARVEKSLAPYAERDFDASKIPNTKPGIAGLYVDDDGRLWVQHAPEFEKNVTRLDVFDAQGKHQGRITLPRKQSGALLPIRARGNLFWITLVDEDDVPYITQYRIQK